MKTTNENSRLLTFLCMTYFFLSFLRGKVFHRWVGIHYWDPYPFLEEKIPFLAQLWVENQESVLILSNLFLLLVGIGLFVLFLLLTKLIPPFTTFSEAKENLYLRRVPLAWCLVAVLLGVNEEFISLTFHYSCNNMAQFYPDCPLTEHLEFSSFLCGLLIFKYAVFGLFEELSTRSFLFRANRSLHPSLVFLVSVLIFGLSHSFGINLAYHFLSGAIYALLLMRTGSILPSLITHFVSNIVMMILKFLPYEQMEIRFMLWVFIPSVALLLMGLLYFSRVEPVGPVFLRRD